MKCVDLGVVDGRAGLPLPLGVVGVRRDLDAETVAAVSDAFRESIEAGLTNREQALRFASRLGRGLDTQTLDRFVAMYVNDLSVDMGHEGRRAVERLRVEFVG